MLPARVLVVDDDPFFLALFSDVLGGAGHDVATAGSADEAEARLPGPDVLLTDLVMPGRDGLSLLARARALDPELEVLVVSQKDEVKVAVEAMKGGAGDYLLKPVDREELQLAVERAAERRRLRLERKKLLDENLEFLRHQALYRRCLELLSTVDPERLHALALDALAGVVEAQAAALWTADDHGKLVLRGWKGGLDRTRLPARLDVREDGLGPLLAPGTPLPAPGFAAEKGCRPPLLAAGEALGRALRAEPRRGTFAEGDRAVARAVGDFAATALKNARRFQQLERVGLRDRETAAYNLSYFVDYASKEAYKARRYGRTFSLVTITLDNLDELRRALGRDEASRATRGLLLGVARICRDADVVAKVADNEFYVLLPETDHFGALMFRRRALAAARADRALRELEARSRVELTLGVATFPKDGVDFDELLHHARLRADEARRSLVRRLGLEGRGFWDSVDVLLGEGALPPDEGPGSSRRGPPPRSFFLDTQAEAARELGRDPSARGLLYVGNGAEELGLDLPLVGALPSRETQGRVYLLGRRGASAADHPATTAVYLDGDEAIARNEFLLFFTEHAAYGLLRRAGASPGPTFHTSDGPLVDHLIAGLQERYDLQPY